MDALRLTALLIALALAVPAAALILRGLRTAPSGAPEPGPRRLRETTFALAPIALLAALIALSAIRS